MVNEQPEPDRPPPPHLYKYLSSTRVDVLANARIRLTQPSQLNDPFEHAAKIDGIFARPDATPESPQSMRDVLAQLFGHGLRYMFKAGETAIRDGYGDKHGALSLTEHADNLLMWAHYGEEHRGFVIEFDTSHAFFRPESTSKLPTGLYPVRYQPERPTLPFSEYYRSILYKSPEWAYENEWRLLLPVAAAANSELRDAQGQAVHLFEFPPACVSSVILGLRAPRSLDDELAELLLSDPRYAHTRLLATEEDPDAYALRVGGKGRIHLLRALRFAEQAEDEEGLMRELDLAVEADPENSYYRYVRGMCRMASSDLTGARSDLEGSVERNPLYPDAWVGLFALAEERGDLDEAWRTIGRAIEVGGDTPSLYRIRAKLAFETGNWSRAIEDSSRALELEPDDLASVWRRASAYAKSGDWESALRDTDRAIELDPDNEKFQQARAFVESQLA